MSEDNNLAWLDEDLERLKKYNFGLGTVTSFEEYYKAKREYLLNPNVYTSGMMKHCFQLAHSNLKCECSCHVISEATLAELTEILRDFHHDA
jgi:hypothetical protein